MDQEEFESNDEEGLEKEEGETFEELGFGQTNSKITKTNIKPKVKRGPKPNKVKLAIEVNAI